MALSPNFFGPGKAGCDDCVEGQCTMNCSGRYTRGTSNLRTPADQARIAAQLPLRSHHMPEQPRLPFPTTSGVILNTIGRHLADAIEAEIVRAKEKWADLGVRIKPNVVGPVGHEFRVEFCFFIPGVEYSRASEHDTYDIYPASSLSPAKAQRGTGAIAQETTPCD
jgi:hypothetical protein